MAHLAAKAMVSDPTLLLLAQKLDLNESGIQESIFGALAHTSPRISLLNRTIPQRTSAERKSGDLIVLLDGLNEAPVTAQTIVRWFQASLPWMKANRVRLIVTSLPEMWALVSEGIPRDDLYFDSPAAKQDSGQPRFVPVPDFSEEEALNAAGLYALDPALIDNPAFRHPLTLRMLRDGSSWKQSHSMFDLFRDYFKAVFARVRSTSHPVYPEAFCWSAMSGIAKSMRSRSSLWIKTEEYFEIFGTATNLANSFIASHLLLEGADGLRFTFDELAYFLVATLPLSELEQQLRSSSMLESATRDELFGDSLPLILSRLEKEENHQEVGRILDAIAQSEHSELSFSSFRAHRIFLRSTRYLRDPAQYYEFIRLFVSRCAAVSDEFSGHAESLRFDVTPKYIGLEALEVAEFEWLENSVFEIRRPMRDLLDSAQPKVHARMKPLVYRWSEHYIGYTALPDVDAYYHQRSLLAAEGMTAQDPFNDAAKFGGLPFGFYKAAVLTLIGWAIKHTHFALLLAKRHTDLSLQNLVTVTTDVETLASSLASALDVTTQEASQALGVLELNSQNVKELSINGHAPPPLIRAASEQFIRPVSGCLIEPFQCMVRNLRANYRNDWDLHVNERETFFRKDLFDLFSQSWLIKIPKSVILKRGGRNLTDVDALIVDEKNEVAGLFQLKWQDGFGHSMRERSAKMKNFCREASSWTDAVASFLSNSTSEEINRTLRLPKSSRPTECRLFVVGGYFAHFSGDASPDDRAAYGVWPQLVRLMRTDPGVADPIRTLHSALTADSPLKRKITMPSSSFRIGNSVIMMNGIG